MITQSKSGVLRKLGWTLMLFLAALLFLIGSRYLALSPDDYFPQQKAVYTAHTTGLLTHILGAMLAIILGPFQFIAKMRTDRLLPLHRWMGRIYLLAVLFGGLGGLYMSFFAYGGWFARIGFAALAIAWLFTAYRAYRSIRGKEIERHRQWMIRNYALTFAGVTLRLWLMLFQVAGLEFTASYIAMAWLSWVPNLVLAEWMFNRVRRMPIYHLSAAE